VAPVQLLPLAPAPDLRPVADPDWSESWKVKECSFVHLKLLDTDAGHDTSGRFVTHYACRFRRTISCAQRLPRPSPPQLSTAWTTSCPLCHLPPLTSKRGFISRRLAQLRRAKVAKNPPPLRFEILAKANRASVCSRMFKLCRMAALGRPFALPDPLSMPRLAAFGVHLSHDGRNGASNPLTPPTSSRTKRGCGTLSILGLRTYHTCDPSPTGWPG